MHFREATVIASTQFHESAVLPIPQQNLEVDSLHVTDVVMQIGRPSNLQTVYLQTRNSVVFYKPDRSLV